MKHVLLEAKSEILELRRQNDILHAKVDTMDLLARFLFTVPAPAHGPGAKPDIAWQLQKLVDAIDSMPSDQLSTVYGESSKALAE